MNTSRGLRLGYARGMTDARDAQDGTDPHGQGILARPGVGLTARVVQRGDLRFSRIVNDRPALILLRHGAKTLQSAGGLWSIRGGEAIAIAGGQTFDVTNRLSDRGLYEACWLIWGPAVIEGFERNATALAPPLAGAAVLDRLDADFTAAFDRAIAAITNTRHIPEDVAAHRVAEMLLWLAHRGIRFSPTEDVTLAMKLRRLFVTDLAASWTAAIVAKRLAMSEATLRRRLAAEGTTLGDLLTDVRMSTAMVLLQSTDFAVNRIALEVGYESASRFAIRFRDRFGFPPTAIRGHARDLRSGEEMATRNEVDQAQGMRGLPPDFTTRS
ncbi:helix-turn-helix domain-containing protein [Ferrovibrio sp.]|uniref:helix-turn-helix transcriptional regulator n=1 Tax=Ferrovibrio sp. TaxID=1917215 RepID=UPI00262C5145|nr:helix-turn-helix domain-containing protein [Ferrovibrio sp.]